MLRAIASLVLVAFTGLVPFQSARASEQPLTIVELFTSQGCSSCPPADAMIGELAKRSDILPLSVHVDYWDYLGWKDPFASAVNTARQRQYAERFGLRYVYTPQIVIHGTAQATGSDRGAVMAAIESVDNRPSVKVGLRHGIGDELELVIGDGRPLEPATIWMAVFDFRHATHVARGENSGRKMTNYNVVRRLIPVGPWTGQSQSISLTMTDGGMFGDACAAWIQGNETGRILGVARLDLPTR